MNLFIHHAREQLLKSRVAKEIKAVDDFVKYENGYIRIDTMQLSVAYRRKHVGASLKTYGQVLINFLIPSMTIEVEETIFNFVIKGASNIIATISFDIDKYRRKLIKEIEKSNKFWEARLIEHEVVIYIDEPLRNEQIYRCVSRLDSNVTKANTLHTPVPTIIRFIGTDDGRHSITVNSKTYNEENDSYA